MKRKVMLSVYLDPDQDRGLRTLRDRTRRSVASLIRDGVDLLLERDLASPPAPADPTSPEPDSDEATG